jgi:EAL and modified HD-GYP domain-containing signal transduction protein
VGVLDVVVGRQAIFDREQVVVGYELLFRQVPGSTGAAHATDGELMTAQVVLGAIGIGVERLVGDKQVFVNAGRELLTGETLLALPPERVVIEVLETVVPDADALTGCRRLVDAGYKLALDDVVSCVGLDDLLELASIVKVDLLGVAAGELPDLVRRGRDAGVDLLAEKVETPRQLEASVELGFDYFQGYLLSRPQVVAGRALEPDEAVRLQLAGKLIADECDVDEIEQIVQSAPGLVYQLLALAGIGAAHGTRRPVDTIRDALVLLGRRRLQSWAAILLIAGGRRTTSEQSTTALVRARMCELLASGVPAAPAGLAFAAGMVSAFDVLLGVPLDVVLDGIGAPEELRIAASGGRSPVGDIVADVTAYQLSEPGAPGASSRCDLGLRALASAWTEAVEWALEVSRRVA